MHFITVFAVFVLLTLQQCLAQQYIGQSSGSSGGEQYPRIKIAGPLGQLIGGNGISLGSGLGAVLNSLVSTAAGSGSGGGLSAQSGGNGIGIGQSSGGLSSAYLRGFGSSLNGYSIPQLSLSGSGSQSMSSPFGSLASMPSLSSLYATSAKQQQHSPQHHSIYPNLQFSSFNDNIGQNDGSLYGQSSNSIPFNIFGSSQQLSPLSSSSSSLSSLYGVSSNPHLLGSLE